MKTVTRIARGTLLMILITAAGYGQSIDDGVKLINNPTSVGARSQAMGAFIGVADDFSAAYWNPAGLGLIRRPEFSFGIANLSTSNDATFLNATANQTNSATVLNNIGFTLPFPVVRGSLVFAIGYNRINNFNYARSFEGYNTGSSIIPALYDEVPENDLAWNLGLEDSSGATPIHDNVYQRGDVTASGSLNQFGISGSLEVMRNLSFGFTFNILSGSYRREKSIVETDTKNMHQGRIADKNIYWEDFRELDFNETIDQDYSGWTTTFGLMYDWNDRARFGVAIKTPQFISVQEDYSYDGRSFFANRNEAATVGPFKNDYSVTTPWIFSFGLSAKPVEFVTLAGDLDLIDNKSLEFTDAPTVEGERHLRDLNREIRDARIGLRSTMNYRLGAEVTVPNTGLQLRGGFGYRQSPYVEDKGKSDFDGKTFSFGVGYLFESTFMVNATFARSSYSTYHYNYAAESSALDPFVRTDEKIGDTSLMFSIAYRF